MHNSVTISKRNKIVFIRIRPFHRFVCNLDAFTPRFFANPQKTAGQILTRGENLPAGAFEPAGIKRSRPMGTYCAENNFFAFLPLKKKKTRADKLDKEDSFRPPPRCGATEETTTTEVAMHIDSRHETDMTAQGWLLAAVQPRSLPMASNLSTESAEVGADVPGASIAAAKRMHVQSNTDAGGRFSARAVVNELGVAAAERGDDAQYGPSGKARLGISNRATANLTPTKAGQEQTDTPNAKAFAADSSAATAEQSTLSKLEARDRQVKDREAAQGQAVSDAAYIYQTGPDGKRYAIGTRPHLVRKGGEEETAGAESAATNATGLPPAENKLSAEQRQDLDRLQARDKEVRNHEQAHLTAAGGRAAGGPEYTYQKGPDGKQYAVGGSVHVSLESGSGDPDADMRNARAVQRAALAPAGPSGQDAIVAAKAGQTLARAAAEAAESPESSTGATDEELSPASQAGASSATSAQEEHGVGLGVNVSDAGSNPKNLRNLQAYGNAASPEQSFFQSIA